MTTMNLMTILNVNIVVSRIHYLLITVDEYAGRGTEMIVLRLF